jgi:hypothetical protein
MSSFCHRICSLLQDDLPDERTGVGPLSVAPRDELVDVNHLVPITCLAVKSEMKVS